MFAACTLIICHYKPPSSRSSQGKVDRVVFFSQVDSLKFPNLVVEGGKRGTTDYLCEKITLYNNSDEAPQVL